ncbi:hypothetical protein [Lysinibacter sp. HNR]|uniref:hypothetical protein n=1 Tax=Lysinibacter sp. HNR TaxID=3031408 RepID=UPI00243507FA|nr:hypothetical protein [Lysinibacter sp. HNR]WGD38478.1 hypothetical protein FrondiHNR_06095 [Lysinibacter sp. HNR]
MIDAEDIKGADSNDALRVLGYARTIAPCLDSLPPGRDRDTAIAILTAIAREVTGRGSRFIKTQRVGSAGVEYVSVESVFSPDDRATLRALCSADSSDTGPVGSFPRGDIVSRVWPEEPGT